MLLFVIGVLVSVPVSVFANVMTPRWQAFWSNRSERSRKASKERSEAEKRLVEWLAVHPAEMQAIFTAAVGRAVRDVGTGILGTVLFTSVFPQLVSLSTNLWTLAATGVFFLVMTVGSLAYFFTGGRAMFRVRTITKAVAAEEAWPIDLDTLTWKGEPRSVEDLPKNSSLLDPS
ncbi:hypothetical protein [Actinoplanes sp. NPDC026619]|uniref:hypothetical protein n=1 Tax=Actinoplanes sp. NPDC026619 TaxID=3155798 RepID=UPI0033C389CB